MFGQNKPTELHMWVEARLSDYIDNQLPVAERARLEQHIGECQQCRASFESMRWTIALVKHAPAAATHRSFTLAMPTQRTQPAVVFGFARLATALATLALFAIIGVDLIWQFGGIASAPAPMMAPAAEKMNQPTSVAFAPTRAPESTKAPEIVAAPQPTQAPKAAGAVSAAASSAAPLPPAPANVPPPAPTNVSAPAGAEASRTQSALDASKAQTATQSARQPALGGNIITPTITLPTATTVPTSTSMPPTETPAPTLVAQAREQVTPATSVTAADSPAPLISPLRAAEIGLFFLAIFFATLTVLLWRQHA